MQHHDSESFLYMVYLLSCFDDSIDDKIDTPPVSFENFCKKIDKYSELCYNIRKNREDKYGFK